MPTDLSPLKGSLLGSESMMDIDSQDPQLVVSSDIDIQTSQSDVSPKSSISAMCPAALSQQHNPQRARMADMTALTIHFRVKYFILLHCSLRLSTSHVKGERDVVCAYLYLPFVVLILSAYA